MRETAVGNTACLRSRPATRIAKTTVAADPAAAVEQAFAEDLLAGSMAGLSLRDIRQHLDYVADPRRLQLGLPAKTGARSPSPFMDLQNVLELTNFFERRVSAHQVGLDGRVAFDHAF